MMADNCNIKKDDKVKVIAGKDKGKIGKVLKVNRKSNRLLVEKINIVKRHTRPSQKNRQGGIVEKEAPISYSNVLFYSASEDRGVRIGIKHENDERVRVSRPSGEVI